MSASASSAPAEDRKKTVEKDEGEDAVLAMRALDASPKAGDKRELAFTSKEFPEPGAMRIGYPILPVADDPVYRTMAFPCAPDRTQPAARVASWLDAYDEKKIAPKVAGYTAIPWSGPNQLWPEPLAKDLVQVFLMTVGASIKRKRNESSESSFALAKLNHIQREFTELVLFICHWQACYIRGRIYMNTNTGHAFALFSDELCKREPRHGTQDAAWLDEKNFEAVDDETVIAAVLSAPNDLEATIQLAVRLLGLVEEFIDDLYPRPPIEDMTGSRSEAKFERRMRDRLKREFASWSPVRMEAKARCVFGTAQHHVKWLQRHHCGLFQLQFWDPPLDEWPADAKSCYAVTHAFHRDLTLMFTYKGYNGQIERVFGKPYTRLLRHAHEDMFASTGVSPQYTSPFSRASLHQAISLALRFVPSSYDDMEDEPWCTYRHGREGSDTFQARLSAATLRLATGQPARTMRGQLTAWIRSWWQKGTGQWTYELAAPLLQSPYVSNALRLVPAYTGLSKRALHIVTVDRCPQRFRLDRPEWIARDAGFFKVYKAAEAKVTGGAFKDPAGYNLSLLQCAACLGGHATRECTVYPKAHSVWESYWAKNYSGGGRGTHGRLAVKPAAQTHLDIIDELPDGMAGGFPRYAFLFGRACDEDSLSIVPIEDKHNQEKAEHFLENAFCTELMRVMDVLKQKYCVLMGLSHQQFKVRQEEFLYRD